MREPPLTVARSGSPPTHAVERTHQLSRRCRGRRAEQARVVLGLSDLRVASPSLYYSEFCQRPGREPPLKSHWGSGYVPGERSRGRPPPTRSKRGPHLASYIPDFNPGDSDDNGDRSRKTRQSLREAGAGALRRLSGVDAARNARRRRWRQHVVRGALRSRCRGRYKQVVASYLLDSGGSTPPDPSIFLGQLSVPDPTKDCGKIRRDGPPQRPRRGRAHSLRSLP